MRPVVCLRAHGCLKSNLQKLYYIKKEKQNFAFFVKNTLVIYTAAVLLRLRLSCNNSGIQ